MIRARQLLGALLLPCALLAGATGQQLERALPVPGPEYGPAEVVRIQLAALQANDDPYPDAGIEITFAFASPGNRQNTGPLERFARMIRGPYRDMLYHTHAEYGPLEVEGDRARLPVILTSEDGRRSGYLFILSRQRSGEFSGSWMTDAVLRFEVRQPTEV